MGIYVGRRLAGDGDGDDDIYFDLSYDDRASYSTHGGLYGTSWGDGDDERDEIFRGIDTNHSRRGETGG